MLKRSFNLFFSFFFLSVSFLKGTHNRAGEITYKRIAPFTAIKGGVVTQVYTYSITVTKYTDDGPSIADRCEDTVYFGDGERGMAPRINGTTSGCTCGFMDGRAITCGSVIISDGGYRVKKNVYSVIHTYPGPGTYTIRSLDPNRNQGVRNIPNSVNIPFYIESMLVINSFTGANSSPEFAFAPVDRACFGVCFEHNPGAYDPDGDSLSYEITTSRGENGQTVPLYFYPETGPGGIFEINPTTGLLRWCTPQYQDEYNIAFIVKEWRKNTSGQYQLIGYVLRDMQVIVKSCLNDPPSIEGPDICIEAGKTSTTNLVVRDPNDGNLVIVQGGGGAFSASNPIASFNPASGITYTSTGSAFNVLLSWNTTCDHIRRMPYQTTFKVEDNGTPVKLVSFKTINIRVVPPSVKDVTASPQGSTMRLSWSLSSCNPADNPLVNYLIYRKSDCDPYIADPCQPGIDPGSDFVLIGEVAPGVSSFIDDNKGIGLVVGEDYSYLVLALYKDGSVSFNSSQVCAKLKRDVPVLVNVDVDTTSPSNGSIWIRWARPLTTPGNLDTIAFPGPYRFDLKHRSSSTDPFTLVQSFSGPFLALLDTEYVHTNLNTEAGNEDYLIELFSNDNFVGSSQRASSVFLHTIPSDRRIDLQWRSATPWRNYNYRIMRQDSTSPNFVLIATTTLTSFSDTTDVVNGSLYCYYIVSEGKYSDPGLPKPLENASQISCARAIDLTPPVTPSITINADCPTGRVEVRWTDVRNMPRSDDVFSYLLYYKPLVSGEYRQIALIPKDDALVFLQDDINSFSGCYAVRAVDISGNESPMSPDFCIDNCPEFELPNIFSPNDDGANDFFKAVKVRQIKEINLSIVDRWGALVYSTNDPYFQWDGTSALSKTPVSEGTFFYVCDVFEPRLRGVVKRTLKGTVQVVR